MANIAIIPARGGSRRIPRKNIKLFHGKPIIAYSIETALNSDLFDRVVVSTDDTEIAEVSVQFGAEIHWRDEESSRNEVGTQEVAARVLEHLNIRCGYSCVIYATAPMLSVQSLINARNLAFARPFNKYVVPVATWLQDPGQFYFGKSRAFLKRVPLIGPYTSMIKIDPRTECDINTPEDWERAERMYAELHNLEMTND